MACACALPLAAFAQKYTVTVNPATLISLYRSLLNDPNNAYVNKRIADERVRIRKQVETDLKSAVDAVEQKAQQADESIAPSSQGSVVENQQHVVDALQAFEQENKADLDLLKNEESVYVSPSTQTGSANSVRQTTSYPELLALKAIQEEKIAAADSMLLIEQERLSSLIRSQRFAQFSVVMTIGKYIAAIVVIMLFERFVRSIILEKIHDRNRRYFVTKTFKGLVYLVMIIVLVTKVLSEYPNILTTLAIVGAGLVVALQDVIKDIVGWLLIMQRRMFTLGDRIIMGNFTGEVIDIGLLQTTLLEIGTKSDGGNVLERTGKTFFVPNSLILNGRLLNYNTTSDYTKMEMRVTVTYETDHAKVQNILKNIVTEETKNFAEEERLQHNRRTRQFYVPYEPGSPQVFLELGASGFDFTLRFTVPIGEYRVVTTRIAERMLGEFKLHNIDLAYPTFRSISTPVPPEYFQMPIPFQQK
jgi:small-conductance mechanosensitive channel